MPLFCSKNLTIALSASLVVVTTSCGPKQLRDNDVSRVYSLTNSKFSGKKTYFGWGAAGNSDPSSMQNEVKYDVLHTHDIFTTGAGGTYQSNKLIATAANRSAITQQWSSIKNSFNSQESGSSNNNMYVQYSSGHGFEGGLGVGVSYGDMASAALSMNAKETIVFTMACHSGGLVNAFDSRRSEWAGFEASGKSLLVMASSTLEQTSSTGPGSDASQQGPQGSAGSAYGHALWKALSGASDGYIDGVKDGYISLGEIVAYSTDLTKKIGGHTPVFTGAFDPLLIMNRVPSSSYLSSVNSASDSSSNYEIAESALAMDQTLARESDALVKKNPMLRSLTYAGQLYVSIAVESDTSPLLVSGPSTASSVVLCEGTTDLQCTAQTGKALTFAQAVGAVKIYKTDSALALQTGKKFGFVAFDSAGQVVARRTVSVAAQTVQPLPSPDTTPSPDGTVAIQELKLTVPNGWSIKQDAVDEQKIIIVLRSGTKALSLYVGKQTVDLKSTFASSGAQVTKAERAETIGSRSWQRLDSSKTLQTGAKGFSGTKNVSSFKLDLNGSTYYGYGTGASAADAESAVTEVLGALR